VTNAHPTASATPGRDHLQALLEAASRAGFIFVPPVAQVRRCRVCACTDTQACQGGCHWVDVDLCSSCGEGLDDVERGVAVLKEFHQQQIDRLQAYWGAEQLLGVHGDALKLLDYTLELHRANVTGGLG
jgi:hypothetical protein